MLLAALVMSAQAQDVAITEFINDSFGAEPAAEWVELYNYGQVDADLSGYILGDEDADAGVIPNGAIVPAGGYLILASDPAQFIADWGIGTAGVDVVQVTMTLANGADELVLSDPTGGVVWSLAYDNDETLGFTTWLTDTTFGAPVTGSKAYPGVVRNGDDTTGIVGYEDGFVNQDPYAVTAANGDIGSPMDGPYGGAPPVAPSLSIRGVCPGTVDISASNVTPGGQIALLTGSGPGNQVIPGGPCAGLTSGLSGLTFRGLYGATPNGTLTLSPNLGGGACGAGVQMLDVATCTLTNIAQIP